MARRRAQCFVDDAFDVAHEAGSRELLGVAADPCRIPLRGGRARQARRERINSRVGYQDTGLAVDHRVERAGAAERHYRTSAGLRFDRDDAEIFFARQHRGDAGLIELANLVVFTPADEFDAVTGVAFEARALG